MDYTVKCGNRGRYNSKVGLPAAYNNDCNCGRIATNEWDCRSDWINKNSNKCKYDTARSHTKGLEEKNDMASDNKGNMNAVTVQPYDNYKGNSCEVDKENSYKVTNREVAEYVYSTSRNYYNNNTDWCSTDTRKNAHNTYIVGCCRQSEDLSGSRAEDNKANSKKFYWKRTQYTDNNRCKVRCLEVNSYCWHNNDYLMLPSCRGSRAGTRELGKLDLEVATISPGLHIQFPPPYTYNFP